jgi:hypothetical protein
MKQIQFSTNFLYYYRFSTFYVKIFSVNGDVFCIKFTDLDKNDIKFPPNCSLTNLLGEKAVILDDAIYTSFLFYSELKIGETFLLKFNPVKQCSVVINENY